MNTIDWHAGFVSAMRLELIENERDLVFEEEHPLANRAQRIDLLIIKNNNNAAIHNPIGKVFSRFNICEYKSPRQSLTYGDFYKILSYTGLYLEETQRGENHTAADYTMTFVREPHPYNLFKRLSTDGVMITMKSPGIYHLSNNLPFATQVIVTGEIPDNRKSWLACLTNRGTAADLKNIISNTPALDRHNKRYADNVMDIFATANNELIIEQIKEPSMCKAVDELFAERDKQLEAVISDQRTKLADMGAQLAKKDALIAKLQAELEKYAGQSAD